MRNVVLPPEDAPDEASPPVSSPLLRVRGLRVELAARPGGPALVGGCAARGAPGGEQGDERGDERGVDFEIAAGESVGLVGDSGSGKTLTALSILGLLPAGVVQKGGSVELHSRSGRAGAGRERERTGGARSTTRRAAECAAMVFQEPRTALNPLLSIGYQIGEVLRLRGWRGRALESRGLELLAEVAMPDARARWRAFPHELSGGQCQRVMIAMALAAEPRLLIADEPTTALDVSVQAQILKLLSDLQRRQRLALLMISHDLALIAATCQRLLVMERGCIVEGGPVDQIFRRPRAAATRRLLDAARSQA